MLNVAYYKMFMRWFKKRIDYLEWSLILFGVILLITLLILAPFIIQQAINCKG